MNPEQWLSLKWNGGSTMSDRWLNQSKIIHVVPIFQDKSQIKALYKDSAGTLLANCDTLLFLGGTDPEVKKFISESLGKQTIWKKSSSVTRGKSGSSSQSSKRRTWM